ncbi:hypothetical protein GCM10009603_35850 [Nocardiopsis exhalans]
MVKALECQGEFEWWVLGPRAVWGCLEGVGRGFGWAGGLGWVGALHHVLHTAHLSGRVPACGDDGGKGDRRAAAPPAEVSNLAPVR